jgi:hypothetical protein
MEQRLEVAKMLLPFGERVADEDDLAPLFQLERLRFGRGQARQNEEDRKQYQCSRTNHGRSLAEGISTFNRAQPGRIPCGGTAHCDWGRLAEQPARGHRLKRVGRAS